MDETLKRLLDAEVKAQVQVDEAVKERDRIVAEARQEVRKAEQRFHRRVPEIQASFRDKAEERARQSIAELERQYEERRAQIAAAAREAEEEALDAAMACLLDVAPPR